MLEKPALPENVADALSRNLDMNGAAGLLGGLAGLAGAGAQYVAAVNGKQPATAQGTQNPNQPTWIQTALLNALLLGGNKP